MRQSTPRLKTIAAEAARDPQRSPLFHWLWRHHGRLAPDLSGKRVNWTPLIAAAVQAGVKNDRGVDPVEQTMRRTWRKVCQAIAAEQATRAAQQTEKASAPSRKLQPRDLPKDWRPIPVAQRSTGPSDIVNNEDCTPEEAWAGVRRVLDERSGR